MVTKKSNGSEHGINKDFKIRWAFGDVNLMFKRRDCSYILDDSNVENMKEAINVYEKEKTRQSIFESQITNRGFGALTFKDRYDIECSIQKSSLATEDCLWLGCNNNDRMHITQDMSEQIASVLFYFSKYGELPSYFFNYEAD